MAFSLSGGSLESGKKLSISWNSQSGASRYKIFVNNYEKTTTSNTSYSTTLDNSYSSVKKIMEPTCYRAVKSTPISKKEGMVLDKGIFDKSTTNYYRLKMWVNGENVDINNPKYFKVKVNIYGNAE